MQIEEFNGIDEFFEFSGSTDLIANQVSHDYYC